MSKTVYIVGLTHADNGQRATDWEVCGVFTSKSQAERACTKPNHWIGPIALNDRLPDEVMVWPDCYYPRADAREGGA